MEVSMKTIIDGLRYDTETATLIAEWGNSLPVSDFRHAEEDLYQTPKGNYFLHGRGGAMSRWSEPAGDMHGPGESIKPLSYTEAAEWCEARDLVDVLEKHFSDYVKDA
jgi:hypothetical protein